MQRDAALMRVPFTSSPEDLHKNLMCLVDANHAYNATLRVAVVRNKGGLFEAPQIATDADIIAFTADFANWGGRSLELRSAGPARRQPVQRIESHIVGT